MPGCYIDFFSKSERDKDLFLTFVSCSGLKTGHNIYSMGLCAFIKKGINQTDDLSVFVGHC